MRVATKLAVGWGVLIALFVGILAYDLALVNRLARVNQGLSEIEFRAAAVSLEQSRRLAALEEFSRKLLVTRDPAYAERLEELAAEFRAGLRELRFLPLSPAELAEVERLADSWRRLPLAAIAEAASRAERGGEEERRLNAELVAGFGELRARATSVTSSTQAAVAAKVAAAARASGQARTLSWLLVGLALAVSLAVLWLTIRSLNRPLRRLTEGIRSVADGRFTYRPGRARDDEFSRLESSFNEMVERLGELDEAKSRFLSHVSHELKTPLVATQETIKLLLEEIPGPLTARQRRLLELNLQGSRRLAGMIGKLLALSRLEAEGAVYDFARHDLVTVVRTGVEGFEALARDRGLRLVTAIPAAPLAAAALAAAREGPGVSGTSPGGGAPAPEGREVESGGAEGAAAESAAVEAQVPAVLDRDRILQVVENLLENAIKFSPDGGTIKVRLAVEDGEPGAPAAAGEATPARTARAVVEVADQGPGVPAEARERVFERFVQLDPPPHGRDGEGRGVGLGLAICREIVDAHDGDVWVEANHPAGSRFGFWIPLSR